MIARHLYTAGSISKSLEITGVLTEQYISLASSRYSSPKLCESDS